jgi:hypothetical protein
MVGLGVWLVLVVIPVWLVLVVPLPLVVGLALLRMVGLVVRLVLAMVVGLADRLELVVVAVRSLVLLVALVALALVTSPPPDLAPAAASAPLPARTGFSFFETVGVPRRPFLRAGHAAN